MTRALTPKEAAAALRRGVSVEQFVELRDGHLTYLSASASGRGFNVRRHVVRDEGTEDFRDLSEFTPVDEDEYAGEGVVVATTDEATAAVLAAAEHGGSADAWVNFGLAAEVYWEIKLAQTSSPSDDAAQYWRDRDWLAYTVHELPAGVLYGTDGASAAECEELLRVLEAFVALCARLDLQDHEAFVEGCRWHYEHYPHYLGRQRHFSGYEAYVKDRGGPLRVEGPPAAPVWLVRARRSGGN